LEQLVELCVSDEIVIKSFKNNVKDYIDL